MLGAGGKASESGQAGGSRNRMAVGRKRAEEQREDAGKDYRIYHLTLKDSTSCLGMSVALTAAIAWLFYRSVWGLLLFFPVCLVIFRGYQKRGRKKQQQNLRMQFKECIRVVTASLYSGYSVENAFGEAEKELVHLLGAKADMCRELHIINQQIKLNVPVERLLFHLADRSNVEEIFGFGQVFGFAKRSGSDFARILTDTAQRITEKIELERELQTMVAARGLEQKIMNVIPMGMLLFVDFTSPGFLDVMYTGVWGRTIMSICLLVYVGAYVLSGRIVDIRI